LAAPTVLGVIDTYGIELIHPMREGRSPQQIGRKGLSNHRWIVGGKLCLLPAIPAEPPSPVITVSDALAFRKPRCENTP
jgi:hypothetical protein